jgi:hypothetical protein
LNLIWTDRISSSHLQSNEDLLLQKLPSKYNFNLMEASPTL